MTERIETKVGSRVRFAGDRRWWTVQAQDDHFVVLTRQAEFRPAGEVAYTIIDWVRDLRGPCNLIGQGWDFNANSLQEEAGKLLHALNAHIETEAWFKDKPVGTSRPVTELEVEVSYRNNVPIEITEVQ